jgi:excisionase family DNA binding protein
MSEPELLSRAEAAAYLSVKVSYVKRLVFERRLPQVKLGPQVSRIDRRDLDAFIAAGRIEASEHGEVLPLPIKPRLVSERKAAEP